MKTTSNVVIVDAYSSGSLLPPRLHARGFGVVHVRTRKVLSCLPAHSHRGHTDVVIDEPAAFADLLRALVPYRPVAVIAGSETGVYLADALADALGVPGNASGQSSLRRNKYDMIEAVRKAGLRTARHFRVQSLRELEQAAQGLGGYPIVVKPPASGAAEDVTLCHSAEAAAAAFARIYKKTNLVGLENDFVVVESVLSGVEYIFNTVSSGGVHMATDFACSTRFLGPDGSFASESVVLLPEFHPAFAPLRDYFFKVLDAIGIRHGAAHGELKLDSELGPALIECGARLMGCQHPELVAKISDCDPIDLTIDAYTNREAFLARASRGVTLHRHAREVFLMSGHEGQLERGMDCHPFGDLASFDELRTNLGPGETLRRTVDLRTSPGFIRLIHEDAEVVAADHLTIRQREPLFYSRLLAAPFCAAV